ncbi:helix-turn-helix transcriptional regulator [Paenibacillus tritici]|uniref:Helix-turn-helix transcriptional regulator n=1 Tax=Paenibacillus tritici TaxID=1873425 RepID=A0ABX2DVT7_9BACL|nr:AraC family transcriptional regulator [Paenibacillus tritici]NQX48682.1 helix-turn-helix transcriptional regulator [Paenibacillus tritici]
MLVKNASVFYANSKNDSPNGRGEPEVEKVLQNLAIDIHWIHDKITFPHWSDIRQNMNVHSLYWIQEGEGVFRTDDEHPVSPGMLFYLRPGLSMEMKSGSAQPLRITMILLSLYTLSPSADNRGRVEPLEVLPLPFLVKPGKEQGKQLSLLFHRIAADWVPASTGSQLMTQSLLYQLLNELLQAEAHAHPDRGQGYELFLRIKDDLERRYSDPLHIHDLAVRYGISSSYLRSLFQQYLHQSPKVYLSEIRYEHAKKLLLYTRLTLKEIAAACGYSDEFHFSKAFKQLGGQPPSVIRTRSDGQG